MASNGDLSAGVTNELGVTSELNFGQDESPYSFYLNQVAKKLYERIGYTLEDNKENLVLDHWLVIVCIKAINVSFF